MRKWTRQSASDICGESAAAAAAAVAAACAAVAAAVADDDCDAWASKP